MQKQKTKKWTQRIIMTLLLSLVLLGSAPALLSHFSDANEYTAYAADENPEPDPETPEVAETVDDTLMNTVKFLFSIQRFLNTLIWPVLVMIGGLLDNSLLFGSSMEARLREIWIPIRNIVNILFVIVLVGIALYNVLGIGDENSNYSIKAALPKIIVGIIAVNFSFLGIKVFLDAINVLTVSIFSLPGQVNEELAKVIDSKDEKDKEIIKRFCMAMGGKSISDNINSEGLKEETDLAIYRITAQEYVARYAKPEDNISIEPKHTKEDITQKIKTLDGMYPGKNIEKKFNEEYEKNKEGQICNGFDLTPQGKIFLLRWNSRNAALAMALNMSKIVFYQDIPPKTFNVEKIMINTLFSMMLYLIYAASFVALFIVLLARLVILWLAIALSPVLLLTMAVPVVKEKISGFGEITDKFVQNAIAPLGIALAMSIGWIMLNALGGVEDLAKESSVINFGGATGIPVVGLSTIQDLIVCLGTVAVVWLGVFTAASKTIAAPVTDAMRGALKKVGSFVGTMPLKHAAIIPIDVPGHPGEKYTGEQVMEALHGITDTSAKRGKLLRRIRPGPDTGPEWLRENGKDRTTVNQWINSNSSKIKRMDEPTIRALKELRANTEVFDKLHRDVQDRMKILIGEKAGDKEKAAKELTDLRLVKRDGPIAAPPKPPEKPKPKPTTTKTKITGDTAFGKDGKPLSELVGAGQLAATLLTLAGKVEELAEAAKKGADADETKVKNKIIALTTGGQLPANTKQLEALLAPEAYKNVEDALGGGTNLQEYLEKLSPPAETGEDSTAAPTTTTEP